MERADHLRCSSRSCARSTDLMRRDVASCCSENLLALRALLAAWLVRKFAPGAKGSGSGIPDVEAARRDEQPPSPLILIPVKFLDGVLVWIAQHLYPD